MGEHLATRGASFLADLVGALDVGPDQLEDALAILGVALHSAYVLSFTPAGAPGYHALRVAVDLPGAKTHARPGYWLTTD